MRNPKLVKISLDIIPLDDAGRSNEVWELTGKWNDFIYLPNMLLFH